MYVGQIELGHGDVKVTRLVIRDGISMLEGTGDAASGAEGAGVPVV